MAQIPTRDRVRSRRPASVRVPDAAPSPAASQEMQVVTRQLTFIHDVALGTPPDGLDLKAATSLRRRHRELAHAWHRKELKMATAATNLSQRADELLHEMTIEE